MASNTLERVSDRVFRIEDRFVNLYVVDVGRIVLVDTGTRTAEPRIRSGLKEIGRDAEDIALILLTHHHLDHMGTAAVWQRETRAQVAVHEADAPVVAGDETRRSLGIGLRGKVVAIVMNVLGTRFRAEPVRPDRLLAGSEVIDLLGLPARVIFAPGHTRGSCAFQLPSEGVLFAGDAVNGRGGRATPPMFVEDADIARASFARLMRTETRVLCPGHGTPVSQGPKAP